MSNYANYDIQYLICRADVEFNCVTSSCGQVKKKEWESVGAVCTIVELI